MVRALNSRSTFIVSRWCVLGVTLATKEETSRGVAMRHSKISVPLVPKVWNERRSCCCSR